MSKLPSQTALPTFSVLVEGKDVTTTYEVVSIRVQKEVNRIGTAYIEILDGNVSTATFEASEKSDFEPGKKIEIRAGYHSKEETIYKGIVTSQSLQVLTGMASKMIIECKDEAIKLTVGRKNRYFLNSKDSDIITTILGDYTLSHEVDSSTVTQKEVIQYHATDWDFILMRAELNSMLAYVDDGKLSIKKPELSGGEKLTLTYGDNIYELDTMLNSRSQFAATEAIAWDPSTLATVTQTGTEPSVNQQGDLTGKKLAEVLGLSKLELMHTGVLETTELKAWADAQLFKSRLSKIQGTIKVQGNALVKIGDIIKVEGLGSRFNGKAFVSGLTHEMAEGNWKTNYKMGVNEKWFSSMPDIHEPRAAALFPAVPGLQIGTVLKLEGDPDNAFRVQVKLPLLDSKSEGVWARIARFYASADIGAFFMPEIGDEVVVGFLNDDPRFPVILGMFNSSKLAAPLKPTDANPQKKLITKSKLSLLFDDEKKFVEITTPAKNTVTISDDGKSITLLDQSNNKVELSTDGILLDSKKDINIKAAANINIQAGANIAIKATGNMDASGVNVSHKANAMFSASGNAGAELKTSAIATIQGTLVKIN
ncbi:MAG: type VI secretion system tip protein VgrG [Bacteroidota bacterium]